MLKRAPTNSIRPEDMIARFGHVGMETHHAHASDNVGCTSDVLWRSREHGTLEAAEQG
jgi:hypothetical protein